MASDVCVQLSVRGFHCERPERDGPRAADPAERRKHCCDAASGRDHRVGNRLAWPAYSKGLVAATAERSKISAVSGGDSDALDRSADADAEQTSGTGGDSYDLSQSAISPSDLVS